jgi:hypothetical protein
MINIKKITPGIEAANALAVQSSRSYRDITSGFNVSNETISNVIKLFTASGGMQHSIYNK